MFLSPIHIPAVQVVAILAGFPALYWLNGFTPWSKGLFVHFQRKQRRHFFLSIQILHLLTTLGAMVLLYKSGGSIENLGLVPKYLAIGAFAFLTVGGMIASIGRSAIPEPSDETQLAATPLYKRISVLVKPATRTERYEFVLLSLIAGFCEEFLYRGFGLLALKGLGMSNGWAVLLCALSFALIHGRAAISPIGIYWLIKGIFYGWLYLLTGSLLLVVGLHGFWDLSLLLHHKEKQLISERHSTPLLLGIELDPES